mgnify:FL=1
MIEYIHEILLAFSLTMALIATYLVIKSRDLIKAVVFSAMQSIAYSLAYYLLAAPDIVLAYLAVGVGIYSILLLYAISKTERYEEVEKRG